jgi:transposase
MDGHTHSAFGRLEVVETGRRRRWSEDEKARIVLESLAGPRLVSATARRHGISRSQLLAWHRTLRAERSEAAPVPGFVPAVIVPEPPTAVTPNTGLGCAKSGDDRMELVLGRGRRVIVGAGFDAAALARVLDVLERR